MVFSLLCVKNHGKALCVSSSKELRNLLVSLSRVLSLLFGIFSALNLKLSCALWNVFGFSLSVGSAFFKCV